MPFTKDKVEYGIVKGSAFGSKKSRKAILRFSELGFACCRFLRNKRKTHVMTGSAAAAIKAAFIPTDSAIARPTAGAQAEPMSWLIPI